MTSLVLLSQGNIKKSKKLIKIVNIDGENLHTNWGISMKFLGKITYDKIKSNKKPGLYHLSSRYIFEKNTGAGREGLPN